MDKLQNATQVIDDLFEKRQYSEARQECLKYLDEEDLKTVELYARLGKICKFLVEYAKDKDEEKALVEEGLVAVKKALEMDPEDSESNMWCGALINISSGFGGIKKRIENAFVMKEHFLKALKGNPNGHRILHALGVWSFEVSDLNWLSKKTASLLFSKPLESTYEEALKYLLQAEEIKPGFYNENLLLIGKCYLRLQKYDEARNYFQKCIDFEASLPSDKAASEEAKKLIKECK